jgi:hypothetical protein
MALGEALFGTAGWSVVWEKLRERAERHGKRHEREDADA